MAFRPQNERHAIHEVVFVLTFARNLGPTDVQNLIDAHDKWKDQLPGLKRSSVFEMVWNGETIQQGAIAAPPGGVRFDAHKRDGSLDWRMRADDNWLAINCLTYSRWNEIWARARKLFQDAVPCVANDNRVSQIALQYIDFFDWEGEIQGYDLASLLRRESSLLPANLWNKGPFWHLFQGWFESDNLPLPRRVLKKVHLEGIEQKGMHRVKIDTTFRLDLQPALDPNTELFAGDPSNLDLVMNHLHNENKRIMVDLLTAENAQRISLNV